MNTLTGNEHFKFNDTPINRLLMDFWSWQSSNLLADTVRGVLAEYIVATALDIDEDCQRSEWDDFDLEYDGIRIEIKSGAYLQSELWKNRKLSSKIIFRIAQTHSTFWKDDEIKRRADIYIFCIFSNKDKETANPMLLEQWDFYIVKTSDINKVLGDQKTVSFGRLTTLPHIKCSYDEIKNSIDNLKTEMTDTT